jgi:hypothetical protein
LVHVDDCVKLLCQPGIEVMTRLFGFRQINYADGALESLPGLKLRRAKWRRAI